jgi:hypothetical protein
MAGVAREQLWSILEREPQPQPKTPAKPLQAISDRGRGSAPLARPSWRLNFDGDYGKLTPFRLEAAAIMTLLFRTIPAFARWYRMPRQRWHDNLSPNERAEWAALGLEAAQKKLERRGGEAPESIHMAIAKWATEERRRVSRVPRRSFWVACVALAVSITVGASTLWHWRESERPKLVTTDARLYINHAGN